VSYFDNPLGRNSVNPTVISSTINFLNIPPFFYQALQYNYMIRSWTKEDPSTSKHYLHFPFTYTAAIQYQLWREFVKIMRKKFEKKIQLYIFPVEKILLPLMYGKLSLNCSIFGSRSVICELETLGTMQLIHTLGELIFQLLITTNTFAVTNHHTGLLNNVFSVKTSFICSFDHYSKHDRCQDNFTKRNQ
jgi:hypothetical protein